MRINRFLAAAGLGSRRACERLIREGRVTINGRVCTNLATTIGERDAVKADGRLVRPQRPLYVLLNKPRGFLCTASDEKQRRTIFDLLPPGWPRLSHVGRLDRESEGLLILTNDGDLALRLTHPRYKIDKEYEVALDRPFEPADAQKLREGVRIEGGLARAEAVHRLAGKGLKLVLRQGIKRQIRLMLYALGYEVTELRRTRIGSIRMHTLRPGEWRFLTDAEVRALKAGPGVQPAVRLNPTTESGGRRRQRE